MTDLLQMLLLPPGINLVLLGLGLLLLPMARKPASWLLLLGTVTLYLLSIAPVARVLVVAVEYTPALGVPVEKHGEGAIVVLGAGRYNSAPEYGGKDTVGHHALMRLRYAEFLREQTGLPILTTGGRPDGDRYSEAELMSQSLKEDFEGLARWREQKSRNTFENAICTESILSGQSIGKIFLVTHAVHMPRAIYAFEKTGLKVTPAPIGYLQDTFKNANVFQKWLPSVEALQISRTALHEWLGLLYYETIYGKEGSAIGISTDC